MIFIDKLQERDIMLDKELDRLFDLAIKKQTHLGDLLLLKLHGFHHDSDKKHVFGPSSEGHSEYAHYSFIHKYRTTYISKHTFEEYIKLQTWTEDRRLEIDNLVDIEETSIQLEMLVYIKFWEADMVIKKLYQLVRILHGQHYDWYFKIQKSPGDKTSNGSRQDLIRLQIRDKIKQISPIFYDLIKNTYKTQIRNSIAHSNYSFIGRSIHLNNYIKDDKFSQLHGVSFDDWIDIFHNTLALHNQYMRLNNKVDIYYKELALKAGNKFEIRVTDKKGKQYNLAINYRPEFEDWIYENK